MDAEEFQTRFLNLPLGCQVPYQPGELEQLEPIIALSDTVVPHLVAVYRLADGSDLLLSILRDKQADRYQLRGRFRDSAGRKDVLPETEWTCLERIEPIVRELLEEQRKIVDKYKGTLQVIEFAPEATAEQMLEQMVASGIFQVVRFDPQEGTAKRVA